MNKKDHQTFQDCLEQLTGHAIQDYVSQAMASDKPASVVIVPPEEYTEVVRAGKQVVPYLIQFLQHDQEYVRIAAFMALTEITNQQIGGYQVFQGDSAFDRKRREEAISDWHEWWSENSDKTNVDWLIADLQSNDKIRVINAIIHLGSVGNSSAIPPLQTLLRDRVYEFYAAASLGRLGDDHAIPYLIDLYLRHENIGYRREGIEILENLTGFTFAFEPEGSSASRRKSIEQWERWWKEQGRAGTTDK